MNILQKRMQTSPDKLAYYKRKKIQLTWMRNCKVMMKLNGTPEEAKFITTKDVEDLDIYKR